MTEEQFVKKWRAACLMLGMDSLATLSGPRELKEHKAQTLLELPSQIDNLLRRMYQDLKQPANGQPQPQRAKA